VGIIELLILYIKMKVCLFVSDRSEQDFAHVFPLVWKRPWGMYGPKILDLFDLLGTFFLGATAELWAQDGCRRDRFP
jgi:hypothetical protein